MVGLVGPLASLAALQMTIAISSRVNDPRSAQQIAVLLVLPLVVMLVGQIAGAFIVTTPVLLMVSLALAVFWLALIAGQCRAVRTRDDPDALEVRALSCARDWGLGIRD